MYFFIQLSFFLHTMRSKVIFHLVLLAAVSLTTCQMINKTTKEPEKVIDVSKANVYYEDETFTEKIDFTDLFMAFPVSTAGKEARFNKSVTFVSCTFDESVLAYSEKEDGSTRTAFEANVSFINCTFKKGVVFRGSTFQGTCLFNGCDFEDEVDFQAASFFSDAYFEKNSFADEAKFQNCYFQQKANFLESSFSENASFQGSTFNLGAQFGVVKLYGYADFSLCDFRDGAFFNYAEIVDRATFNNTWFGKRADFNSVIFNDIQMRNCTFTGKNSLKKLTVSTLLNMEESLFYLDAPKFEGVSDANLQLNGVASLLGANQN